MDGQPWPAQDDDALWLPAGPHAVEASAVVAGPKLVSLTGELKAVRPAGPNAIEFTYQSGARVIAIVSRKPVSMQIDGEERAVPAVEGNVLLLPRGQHVVTLTTD